MKTLFNIQGEATEQSEMLLMELGADQVKIGLYSKENDHFSHIRIYETDEIEIEKDLAPVLHELRQRKFARVFACSSFPQALMIPRFKTGDYADLWKTIYQQPLSEVMKDDIPEWQIANIYALPVKLHQQLLTAFPGIHFIHNFSCALKNYNGFDQEDQVSIDFSTKHFRVLVKKKGRIELAQIYSYVQPLDVVYYLLKINAEIGLDQSAVLLVLSGLVEKDSAMYQLLNDYYSNIVFATGGNMVMPQNDLPPHFFVSIKNLAACAS